VPTVPVGDARGDEIGEETGVETGEERGESTGVETGVETVGSSAVGRPKEGELVLIA